MKKVKTDLYFAESYIIIKTALILAKENTY